MDEVTKTKSELFDVLRQKDIHLQQVQQLDNKRMELLKKLQELEGVSGVQGQNKA